MATEAIENPNPRKIPKTIERIGWESLPCDLLVRIYEKLPIEELVVGAPVACRQWYVASLDPSLYKVLDLRNWRRIFDWVANRAELGDFLRIVVPRGKGEVERVMFPHLVGDSDLVFVADSWDTPKVMNVWAGEAEHAVGMPQTSYSIYRRCPNIKFLFLRSRGLGLISEEAIFHAISRWKDLESMDVDESCLTSKILSAIHSSCQDFISLTIVAGRLTEDTALNIVRFLPKLKSIDLSYTVLSNDTLFAILKGCKELESLDVTGCRRLRLDRKRIRKYTAGLKRFECDGGLCPKCDGGLGLFISDREDCYAMSDGDDSDESEEDEELE